MPTKYARTQRKIMLQTPAEIGWVMLRLGWLCWQWFQIGDMLSAHTRLYPIIMLFVFSCHVTISIEGREKRLLPLPWLHVLMAVLLTATGYYKYTDQHWPVYALLFLIPPNFSSYALKKLWSLLA